MDNIKCNYQKTLSNGKWSIPCNKLITDNYLICIAIKERNYGYNNIYCLEHNKKKYKE